MEAIWKAGQEFELNVFDLEERLLSQMLFTGEFSDKAFQIFQDYHSLGGKGIVSRAYMTWLAYQDLDCDCGIVHCGVFFHLVVVEKFTENHGGSGL